MSGSRFRGRYRGQGIAGEHNKQSDHVRCADVGRRTGNFTTAQEREGLQAERCEGGESAENPAEEEHAGGRTKGESLRDAPEKAYREAADDIDEERTPREGGSQVAVGPAGEQKPEDRTDRASGGDEEDVEKHRGNRDLLAGQKHKIGVTANQMAKTSVFDRYAGDYDTWFDTHAEVFVSELDAVRALLPNRGKGVEIGAGTGRFAAALSQREQVHGRLS